jgi:hypothetical protein
MLPVLPILVPRLHAAPPARPMRRRAAAVPAAFLHVGSARESPPAVPALRWQTPAPRPVPMAPAVPASSRVLPLSRALLVQQADLLEEPRWRCPCASRQVPAPALSASEKGAPRELLLRRQVRAPGREGLAPAVMAAPAGRAARPREVAALPMERPGPASRTIVRRTKCSAATHAPARTTTMPCLFAKLRGALSEQLPDVSLVQVSGGSYPFYILERVRRISFAEPSTASNPSFL